MDRTAHVPADVLSAAAGLVLLAVGATLGAAAFGLAVLACVAVAVLAAGVALLAWAYLP